MTKIAFNGLVSAVAGVMVLTAGMTAAQSTKETTETVLPWEMPSECSVQGEGKFVLLVLCEEGLGEDDWSQAGRSACIDKNPCGAWIWDDAALLPASAPDNHDGLTQDQVTSALAVWVGEKELLVKIDKKAEN